MKQKSITLAVIAFTVLGASLGQAATIIWNFTGATTGASSGTPVNFSVSAMSIGNSLGAIAAPINSTSASSGYVGVSGTNNIGNAQRTGALNTGASGSGYLEFTIVPDAGYAISLTNFDFGVRSTSTGAQAYTLRSSADAYATDIFSGTIANNGTWSLKDNTFTAFNSTVDGGSVTFRLFGHGGTGSPASGTINTRFDDFTVELNAVAIPEPSRAILLGLGSIGLIFRRRRQ